MKATVIRGPRNSILAVSFKVQSFSSQSHSCYNTVKREFSNCGCHTVSQWQAFSSFHPSADVVHLGAFSQSSHNGHYYLLEQCCSNRFSSNIPTRRGCSWETCFQLIQMGFSSFIPLLLPSIPNSFLTAYLRTTYLWLCCA